MSWNYVAFGSDHEAGGPGDGVGAGEEETAELNHEHVDSEAVKSEPIKLYWTNISAIGFQRRGNPANAPSFNNPSCQINIFAFLKEYWAV